MVFNLQYFYDNTSPYATSFVLLHLILYRSSAEFQTHRYFQRCKNAKHSTARIVLPVSTPIVLTPSAPSSVTIVCATLHKLWMVNKRTCSYQHNFFRNVYYYKMVLSMFSVVDWNYLVNLFSLKAPIATEYNFWCQKSGSNSSLQRLAHIFWLEQVYLMCM